MLRSAEALDRVRREAGRVKGHVDQRLARSPRLYAGLLKELQQIDFLRFTLHPRGHVGVFFVAKKAGSCAWFSMPVRAT